MLLGYPATIMLTGSHSCGKIPNMTTVTADERKRVRIPDARPGQVFTYVNNGNGSYTLTPIQPETTERFPRGSLLKYFTPEKDKEETQILAACVQYPEPE